MCGRGRVGGTRYRPRPRGPRAALPRYCGFQDAESSEQYASPRASVAMRSRPGRARRRRPGPTSRSEPIRLRPGPASPIRAARRRGPVFRQCRWSLAHRARAYHGPPADHAVRAARCRSVRPPRAEGFPRRAGHRFPPSLQRRPVAGRDQAAALPCSWMPGAWLRRAVARTCRPARVPKIRATGTGRATSRGAGGRLFKCAAAATARPCTRPREKTTRGRGGHPERRTRAPSGRGRPAGSPRPAHGVLPPGGPWSPGT